MCCLVQSQACLYLNLTDFGVDFSHHLGPLEIIFILFKEQFASFLVQGGLRVGHDEQALDSLK